jgi:hypothetical protein
MNTTKLGASLSLPTVYCHLRVNQPRKIFASNGYHRIIVTSILVNKMTWLLELNIGKLGNEKCVTAGGRWRGIDPWDFFLQPRYKTEFYLTCNGTRISSTVHTKASSICMNLGPIFKLSGMLNRVLRWPAFRMILGLRLYGQVVWDSECFTLMLEELL